MAGMMVSPSWRAILWVLVSMAAGCTPHSCGGDVPVTELFRKALAAQGAEYLLLRNAMLNEQNITDADRLAWATIGRRDLASRTAMESAPRDLREEWLANKPTWQEVTLAQIIQERVLYKRDFQRNLSKQLAYSPEDDPHKRLPAAGKAVANALGSPPMALVEFLWKKNEYQDVPRAGANDTPLREPHADAYVAYALALLKEKRALWPLLSTLECAKSEVTQVAAADAMHTLGGFPDAIPKLVLLAENTSNENVLRAILRLMERSLHDGAFALLQQACENTKSEMLKVAYTLMLEGNEQFRQYGTFWDQFHGGPNHLIQDCDLVEDLVLFRKSATLDNNTAALATLVFRGCPTIGAPLYPLTAQHFIEFAWLRFGRRPGAAQRRVLTTFHEKAQAAFAPSPQPPTPLTVAEYLKTLISGAKSTDDAFKAIFRRTGWTPLYNQTRPPVEFRIFQKAIHKQTPVLVEKGGTLQFCVGYSIEQVGTTPERRKYLLFADLNRLPSENDDPVPAQHSYFLLDGKPSPVLDDKSKERCFILSTKRKTPAGLRLEPFDDRKYTAYFLSDWHPSPAVWEFELAKLLDELERPQDRK